MSECALGDRSARGYCPGDPGHQEEVDGFEDLTTTVAVTVNQPVTPVTELPYTGSDPLLALLGTFTLVAGAVLIRWSRRTRRAWHTQL